MNTMRPPFLTIISLFCVFTLCGFVQPVLLQAAEISLKTEDSSNISNDWGLTKLAALNKAEQLSLAQHETWRALLHYKHELVSGREISQADDEKFFLHADGKRNAEAELAANINAFFSGPQSDHAQCLFPARWWWLKQQLSISDVYDVQCPQLEAFMRKLAQDKLFLVFPTMYLNNPGSTFGHTFLRFDTNDESILLSQTLNYAARVDETDNIFTYVRKGLFGGYTGFFRIRPYFETVQEYNNIENRDIWEYQLALSKVEITQLARHVWEIKDIDFDYYFFKENCAYRLLAMLDVVRPQMQLTAEGKFPAYAIPVDTVRELDDIGLIKSRQFRASLASEIDASFLEVAVNKKIVLAITSDKTASDTQSIVLQLESLKSKEDKIKVLQQSHNILQFYRKSTSLKAQNILAVANKLGNSVSLEVDEIKKRDIDSNQLKLNKVSFDNGEVSPEKGHDSSRVSVGYGKQNNSHYIDLRFRPAFHDLMDSMQGYIQGAAINSFEARLKWFLDDDSGAEGVRLESLSILNITSLNSVRPWYKPLSWLLDFRFDRTQLSKTDSVKNFISQGGVGLSLQNKGFSPFAMLLAEGNLSSHYRKGYSLLLGLQAGMQLNFKSSRFLLSLQKDKAVSGFDLDRMKSQLQWQYDIQVNHAMRLRYTRNKYDFFDDEDWSLSYNYYY